MRRQLEAALVSATGDAMAQATEEGVAPPLFQVQLLAEPLFDY